MILYKYTSITFVIKIELSKVMCVCIYEIYEISVHIFLYEKFKNIPDITTVKMMVGKIINTVV